MNCNLHPTNPCPARESGGVRCELEAGHEFDLFGTGHYITEHTIEHNLAGNGYVCDGKKIIGIRVFGSI